MKAQALPASLSARYRRARIWTVGTDPGLLRLRLAIRTTIALGCSLLVMSALTSAAKQPLTVALLGAVITMIAARSVNEPDPRQQRITMALLPLPAALSISAAALLSPYRVVTDAVFVVVVFGAVYVRRFGPRGRALGMVAFMAYFFNLFLRAGVHELPWMIIAVVVGTLCTFVMTAYVLPDRPERVLQATIRSLRARMAIVIDTTAEVLRADRLDERRRRRLRARIARLNETALMVQDQIEDKANPATLWLGVGGEHLAPWLFDAELAVEWVAIASHRAVSSPARMPAAARAGLAAAMDELAWAIRIPDAEGLRRAGEQAQRVLDDLQSATSDESGEVAVRRIALAIVAAAAATSEVREMIEHATTGDTTARQPADSSDGPDAGDLQRRPGLLPTTRQAIQASVAASLAIVTGELVSPDRWYWAVIAAFVVFAGTNTWGETLTKGWQRLLGTVLGVPCGILVATLVGGHSNTSLVLIFICLFCSFYFMQLTQSLMAFWITTMLALLYGLLGQFSFDVLLVRIEETAVGAVIGVAVAILVLPTNIGTTLRSDTRDFLTELSALIEKSIATMFDDEPGVPTEQARELDRKLQQIRATAKPLLAGIGGLAGRRSIQHRLRLFRACDRYARILARRSEQYRDPTCPPELVDAVKTAAAQVAHNVDALVTMIDGANEATVVSATDALDAAEALAREHDSTFDPAAPGPDTQRHPSILHPLRQIDHAVIAAATHLDPQDGLKTSSSQAN